MKEPTEIRGETHTVDVSLSLIGRYFCAKIQIRATASRRPTRIYVDLRHQYGISEVDISLADSLLPLHIHSLFRKLLRHLFPWKDVYISKNKYVCLQITFIFDIDVTFNYFRQDNLPHTQAFVVSSLWAVALSDDTKNVCVGGYRNVRKELKIFFHILQCLGIFLSVSITWINMTTTTFPITNNNLPWGGGGSVKVCCEYAIFETSFFFATLVYKLLYEN